jgi:SAM-dependent methyltransferase
MTILRSFLTHPLARGHNLDDPQTTILHQQIIQEKAFLKRIYEEWYRSLSVHLDPSSKRILEIGSGAGFLKESFPQLLTSDLLHLPWLTLVMDAVQIPIMYDSLDALVLVNVLHHISDIEGFMNEASRCVRPGGKIAMIEPWVTTWSKVIYTNFHHEPFDPDATFWRFETHGPLSGAYGALPWMVFERDRQLFEERFPMWKIAEIRLMTPFTYLLSGGVSMRSLMPGWTYGFWRRVEALLQPLAPHLAMFAQIELIKR